MPNPNPSIEKPLIAYQHFLSLLQKGNVSGARGAMYEAVKAAQVLQRVQLQAVLLLKLGRFYMDSEADLQNAAHAFAAGINLLQQNDLGEDLAKVLKPLRRMEKGYMGAQGSLPDGYQPETEEDLLQAEKDPLLSVKLLVSGGICLLELGQDVPALKSFESAVNLPSIRQDEIMEAKVMTNMAEIHRRLEAYSQAEKLLLQAKLIFQKHIGQVDIKEFLSTFASLRSDQEQYQEAIQLFEEAVTLYHQSGDEKGYSRTLIRLAKLYLDQNNFASARPHLESALKLGTQAHDRSNLAFVYQGLARCFLQEGNFRAAVPHLEQCFRTIDAFVEASIQTEQGRISRIGGMRWALNALIDCYLKWKEHDDRPDEIERLILGKIDQLHGLILDNLIGGSVKPFQKKENVDLSDALGFDNQNPMRQTVMADFIIPRERVIDHPRRAKVPSLTRLVYHLTDHYLIIVCDQPQETPIIINLPKSRSAIREEVAELILSLKVDNRIRGAGNRGMGLDVNDSDANSEELLRDWYELLIRPVEAYLPKIGSLLVVEPHDALHMLPFGLLTPKTGTYICDEYAVLVSPSQETMNTLRSYQPYQSKLSSAKALVVGNPDIKADMVVHGQSFDQLGSLPGAEKEASAIQELFDKENVTYLTQAEANEEAIKKAIKDSNIIHLATHGLAFEDHPMSSLIVVAGGEGYVTARTIREWEMPADLVVLSACQTALGRLAETEGVIGLSRSFFIAGARTVVVSLWSVDDDATAKLMEYFYKSLFTGKSVPAAMRVAQLKLKNQARYSHPFYWAGFVVIGADC